MNTDLEHEISDNEIASAVNDPAQKLYTFQGQALKPFSEARRAAAQALGVKLLSGVQTDENGLYDGFLMDAHIIIFLCHPDTSRKLIIKSHRKPDDVLEAVLSWVDDHITPEDYQEEFELIAEILTDAYGRKAIATAAPGTPPAPETPGLGEHQMHSAPAPVQS